MACRMFIRRPPAREGPAACGAASDRASCRPRDREPLLASSLLETGQWQAVRQADLAAWGSLAYATLLGAGVGFALWFWLLGRLPMSRVAPFALLQTVVAMALGVVAMGDQVTLSLVLGALLCLSGVLLTQITPRRKGRAEA
ncbi:MAG: DMT family transporter [Martelella sp.]|uniref:DMT family transporter n=1 Tax=Martelella sp. TaxID=1969699 RepID=UPI00324215E3